MSEEYESVRIESETVERDREEEKQQEQSDE